MSIVIDNPSILKSISKIAKEKGTNEKILVNKYLKEAIEYETLPPRCKEFYKELDRMDAEMDAGNYVEVDADKLEEHFGL